MLFISNKRQAVLCVVFPRCPTAAKVRSKEKLMLGDAIDVSFETRQR
jgi:hypothetical protein